MKIPEHYIKEMITVATQTRNFAFAHRSKHKIGASVLAKNNHIYGGCNVESNISGLGTCAERGAMNHAIFHGQYHFQAICVVDEQKTIPCGACLQYGMLFSQLAEKDILIIVANTKGEYDTYKLSELLPHGYRSKHILDEINAYKDFSEKDK